MTPAVRHVQDRARREVEQCRPVRRKLLERADRHAGLDLAAVLAEDRCQRIGDALRAAARDRPADGVPADQQGQPQASGQDPIQRLKGVRAGAGEQRPGRR